jgi:hypothetical protein
MRPWRGKRRGGKLAERGGEERGEDERARARGGSRQGGVLRTHRAGGAAARELLHQRARGRRRGVQPRHHNQLAQLVRQQAHGRAVAWRGVGRREEGQRVGQRVSEGMAGIRPRRRAGVGVGSATRPCEVGVARLRLRWRRWAAPRAGGGPHGVSPAAMSVKLWRSISMSRSLSVPLDAWRGGRAGGRVVHEEGGDSFLMSETCPGESSYVGRLRVVGARATRRGGVEPRARRTDDAPLNPRGCWDPVGDGR